MRILVLCFLWELIIGTFTNMDPNYNYYANMDGNLNSSFNGSLNSSGEFQNLAGMPGYQNLTQEQLLQLAQINQLQIQQLSAQLAQSQLAGAPPVTSIPYGSGYGVNTPVSPRGHMTFASGVPVSQMSPRHLPARQPVTSSVPHHVPHVIGNVPVNSMVDLSINGQLPASPRSNANVPVSYTQQMAYPNTSAAINPRLQDQIHVQVPNQPGQFASNGIRTVNAPDSLHLQHTAQPRGASYSSSSYSSSPASTPQDSPAMPKKPPKDAIDGPIYMQRPRQRVLSPPPAKPPSDRGSTSSASIPGSPGSHSNPPLSPDGNWSDNSGPLSPDGTPKKTNGVIQIKNKPLQMQTKYPQDKCYVCMKRVYPMEKLGPVKGVVYHKGCFRCKECKTSLNMKNFCHSQTESFDLSVYCKSHQPVSSDKAPKLGSDSFEIKSALNTPKKGGVTPESERVPVHTYSYDVMCQEIEHARKVPVAGLQSGVKARQNAWSKSKREQFHAPSGEVVKSDTPVPEYNADEYTRFQVENEPDYT